MIKRHLISGISSAVCGVKFVIALIGKIGYWQSNRALNCSVNAEYQQMELVSEIGVEECFICGDYRDPLIANYWKEDNIGIINLNTFDVMYIPINRYDINGEQIMEPAGVLESSSKKCGDAVLHAMTDPDQGYSYVDISNVTWNIDKKNIQRKLCPNCISQINARFERRKTAEYAVISFKNKQIRPIVDSVSWFEFGIFGVECEVDDNKLKLKIDYCPLGGT